MATKSQLHFEGAVVFTNFAGEHISSLASNTIEFERPIGMHWDNGQPPELLSLGLYTRGIMSFNKFW